MKVRAKKLGYIHKRRRKPGDEFYCSEQEFSSRWMEVIEEEKKPKSISEVVEEFKEEAEELKPKAKPKRKRRTKAEIEASKVEESKDQSPEVDS